MTAPDRHDPQGTTPLQSTDTDGSISGEQLADAAALEADGTALERMGEAAQEGDARLRAAEERSDLPTDDAPYVKPGSGRGDSTGRS